MILYKLSNFIKIDKIILISVFYKNKALWYYILLAFPNCLTLKYIKKAILNIKLLYLKKEKTFV